MSGFSPISPKEIDGRLPRPMTASPLGAPIKSEGEGKTKSFGNYQLIKFSRSTKTKNRFFDEFRSEIITVLKGHYLDLDESFVNVISEIITKEEDPFGYFSQKKELLILVGPGEVIFGWTVATTKLGGSVKFGPTMILPLFRGLGLYHTLIELREKYFRSRGARKLYCTVPETKPEVWRTLMKHGYALEAKLYSQYRPNITEYVFGKLLRNAYSIRERSATFDLSHDEHSGQIYEDFYISRELSDSMCRQLTTFFFEYGSAVYPVSNNFVGSICEAHHRYAGFSIETYSRKGKLVFLALTRDKHENILAALVSTPKRGGSVKLSPFLVRRGVSKSVVLKLYQSVENFYATEGARKLYLHLPVWQTTLLSTIETLGYQKEGELKEPYMPGVDMAVMGKLLKDHAPVHRNKPSAD